MTRRRILVAGIGNVFLGDDGFGVETVQQLGACDLPDGVEVVDFGIRSYDLAYAIMDGYDVIILVDAVQRRRPPGTTYLVVPDLSEVEELDGEVVNGHSMNPLRVLHLVRRLGGTLEQPLYLVGCEPAVLETEDGRIGLSETVKAAVPKAVGMIQDLVEDLRREGQHAQSFT